MDGDGVDDCALLSEGGVALLTAEDVSITTLTAGAGPDWSDENRGYATGGDFDGDGHGDVLARRSDGTARVLSGLPSVGTVEGATVGLLGESYNISPPLLDIRVADEDGDGRDNVLYAEGLVGYDGAGALVLFPGPLVGELGYAAASVAWAGQPGDHLGMGAWWIDEGIFATTGAGQLLVFTTDD